MRLDAVAARVLDGEEALEAAVLLHEVYCRTGGWTPPPGNPSGFRIAHVDGRAILTDDFAMQSTWFGCFAGADLVATGRLIDGAPAGYEIARYRTLPAWLVGEPGFEVNRFAMRPSGARPDVLTVLIETLLAHAVASGRRHLLTAVAVPEPAATFETLGFRPVGPAPFRYHESDAHCVEALHLDLVEAGMRDLDRGLVRAACDAMLRVGG